MAQDRRLLGIYAHPDDEILGPGGTLARYASCDDHVALVIATRGEAGEIQRPGTATPETLPQVREQEMRCSARELGVSEVIFLGYRDSGMAGTVDNEHPRAFMNAPADEVVRRLVAIIRRLRPQIVLTFEPYGGYGHPDHIAANHHTLAAVQAAADPHLFSGDRPSWKVNRIYYHILPTSLYVEMKQRVAARGGDVSRYDELIEGRAQGSGWPDDQIHAEIDVSDYVDKKWAAWNCHRTQFGPNSRFRQLPEEEMKELLSTEYFALGHPRPDGPLHFDDLFAGLPDQRDQT